MKGARLHGTAMKMGRERDGASILYYNGSDTIRTHFMTRKDA